MKREAAIQLMNETRHSYDQASGEFSASRAKFWDELAFLLEHTTHDDHVVDIGCGNGRLFPLVASRHAHYTGIDYSEKLIAEAKHRNPGATFFIGDATALPFPDQSFDIAYSFAALHHIPSLALRAQFVKETARVLPVNGIFVITVWNLWRAKYFGQLLHDAIGKIFGKNTFDIGDMLLTFGKTKQPRYLHAFTKNELRKLLESNGFRMQDIDIIPRKSGEENIVAVARKIN